MSRLENLGFTVLALCCDGLSANRKFFRLHDERSTTAVYKVVNPYSHNGEKRNIFFLSDPPHLMKMVKNAWANNKRKLWVCIMLASIVHKNLSILSSSVQWNGYLMGPSTGTVHKEQGTG